eukprot:jgi/Bigna1/34391/e_gw1.5.215.1
MRQLLDKRINKTSANIKYKALRTVSYLSENGAVEFRMQWQRDNNILREHTSYKGTPDPLTGDATNIKVREEAKRAMKAIFSTGTSKSSSSYSSKMEGYGSSAAPSSSSGDGGSSYGGFGSSSSSGAFASVASFASR